MTKIEIILFQKQMTQQELINLIQAKYGKTMYPSTISKAVKNPAQCHLITLQYICGALGISLEDAIEPLPK